MSHSRQDNVCRMRDTIEYKVLDLTDYLLEEIKNLEEEKAAQDTIIIGQRDVIIKYKSLLDGMKKVAA